MKEERLKRYWKTGQQNWTVENNKRKFCLEVGGECTRAYQQQDAKKAKEFWSKIWEKEEYNRRAK